MSLVKKALDFAKAAHARQTYGKMPYHMHCCAVGMSVSNEAYIRRLPNSETLVCAAILHDVLEDTETTFDQLKEEFGEDVAKLVEAVTDCPGKNRKEKKVKTYSKIREAGSDAILIKLCDRISNLRHSRNSSLGKMYKKEAKAFKDALSGNDEDSGLWATYDKLVNEL